MAAMAVVKAKICLACKQNGRKRKKSSFAERSKGKTAFDQGVFGLNRWYWAWDEAVEPSWSEVVVG